MFNERLSKIDKSIYNAAKRYIISKNIPNPYLDKHNNWDLKTIKKCNVGSVDNYLEFKLYVQKNSLYNEDVTEERLKDSGILNAGIFNENNVVFCLDDIYGNCIGFIGRKAEHENDAQWFIWNGPYYDKDQYLYGLRDASLSRKDSIFIVEGYSDLLSLRNKGIANAVALGNNRFNIKQLLLLKKQGFKNIVLIMDNDDEGIKTIEIILNTIRDIGGINKISISDIPDNYKDIDDYLSDKNNKFYDLKKIDPYTWKKKQYDLNNIGKNSDVFIKEVLPYLLLEPSLLIRDIMINDLSNISTVSKEVIEREAMRLDSVRNATIKNELEEIKTSFIRKLHKADVDQFVSEVSMVNNNVNTLLQSRYVDDVDQVAVVKNLYDEFENKESKVDGLNTFCPYLTEALGGIHFEDYITLIGAGSNAGKTSLINSIIVGLFLNNKPEVFKNYKVLHFCFDDKKKYTVARQTAIVSGIPINGILSPKWSYPKYDTKTLSIVKDDAGKPIMDPKKEAIYNSGKAEVIKWYENNWIELFDMNDGTSMRFIENILNINKQQSPHKKFLIVIDNFHNLSDFPGLDNKSRFTQLSKTMKRIASTGIAGFLCAVELNKSARNTEPNANDISEARAMEYDANSIIMLYNDLHVNRKDAKYYRIKEPFENGGVEVGDIDNPNNWKPVIKLIMDKNKVNSEKSEVYYKFYDSQSRFEYINYCDLDQYKH